MSMMPNEDSSDKLSASLGFDTIIINDYFVFAMPNLRQCFIS